MATRSPHVARLPALFLALTAALPAAGQEGGGTQAQGSERAVSTEVTSGSQGEASPPGGPEVTPILGRDELLGDAFGLRPALRSRGVTLSVQNVLEYSEVYDGGVEQEDSFRNLFTFGVEVDTEEAAGLAGGTLFAQYLSVTAENGGSADSGDIQVYSDIESEHSLDTLYELWYEQSLLDDRVRLKVGKVDANGEFASVAALRPFSAGGDLTNNSAGYQPTIFPLPTYPDPAMSVNLFVTPYVDENFRLTLGYGFYDGAAGADNVRTGVRGPSTFFSDERSDDWFHVAEAELGWDHLGPLPGGSASVGGWHHTGRFARFDGGTEHGTGGLYATAQQQLAGPAPDHIAGDEGDAAADNGLYVFAQYGLADGGVADVESVYSLGLVLVGLGGVRPDDEVGVYASLADLSDDPAAGFARDELAIEAFYRVSVTPAVYLQPGLQHVVNPSGRTDIGNPLIGQLRLGVTF